MKKKTRKSYFTNFDTEAIFCLLEQNQQELLELEIKYLEQQMPEIKKRMQQIKLTIEIGKKEIINRYLKNNIRLEESAKLLILSNGVKENVYQELFVLKVLENKDLISLDTLKKALQKLEVDQLVRIVDEDSSYGRVAKQDYIKMLFDVDQEIKKELYFKMKADRKGC